MRIGKFSGLQTASNQLNTPEGSLRQADNLVIRSKDIVESRRGQARETLTFGSTSSRMSSFAFFGASKVGLYDGTTLAYDTQLSASGHLLDASTLGLWRFDETTGTTVADTTGSMPLTAVDGAGVTASGQISYARTFDGTNDRVSGTSSAALRAALFTGDFTIESWVYPTNIGTSSRMVFGLIDTVDAQSHVVLGLTSTGAPFLSFTDPDLALVTATATTTVANGAWAHIAVRHRVSTGLFELFVNGVAAGSATYTNLKLIGAIDVSFACGFDFFSSLYDPFAGRIDDTRVSGVVRTTAEILASYQRGIGTAATWSTFAGSHTAADDAVLRMKFAESSQNLYFATTQGTRYITAVGATPTDAGIPRAPDVVQDGLTDLVGNPDADGAWFPADSQVSYRVVFGTNDANGNLKLGAPSGRFVVVNPADAVTTTTGVARLTNVVTATVTGHGFKVGDVVAMTVTDGTAAEADFALGNKTVTAVTSTTFTYAENGANATSTKSHTFSSGEKQTAFTFWVPPGLSTTSFVRIYRTPTTPLASISPGDEHFLVHERLVTPAEAMSVFGVSTTHTDTAPSYMVNLGNALYTNPKTGDGIGSANFQPPVARDLCLFQERLWWANTTGRHSATLQLLGVGSPDGLQNNDTITIAGKTYTAKTGATVITDYEFQITGHFDSAALNVAQTAQNLIYAVNYHAAIGGSGGIRAYYDSAENDPPGKLRFEETALGGSTFYIGASRAATWNPLGRTTYTVTEASTTRTSNVVTVTTGSAHGFAVGDVVFLAANTPDPDFPAGAKTVTGVPSTTTFTYAETGANATITTGTYVVHSAKHASDANRALNGLAYSKPGEPEAVPLLQYLRVGAKNRPILRIIPLRERLYVFKDDGIFVVSGNHPSFRVDLFDNTAQLLAPDSVVVLNNQIFALTTQGVVAISEGGVGLVSRPIEDQIVSGFLTWLATTADTTSAAQARRAVWACAYESEHLYLLGLPSAYTGGSETASNTDQILAYNHLTQTWTRWTFGGRSRTYALVDPNADRLVLIDGGVNTLYQERKIGNYSDYADEALAVTTPAGVIAPGLHTSITFTNTTGYTIAVGDVVQKTSLTIDQAASKIGVRLNAGFTVTAVDGDTVTIEDPGSTVDAEQAWTVFRGIPCALEFAPVVQEPGKVKQFKSIQYHFNRANVYRFGVTSRTDHSTSSVSSTRQSTGYSRTAYTGAGLTGTGLLPQTERLWVPLENGRGTMLLPGLTVRCAGAIWQLAGLTLDLAQISDATSRVA